MCAQILSTQPYKGTRDFYPDDMRLRNWFFGKIRQTLERAAYEEYNGPMLESLDIYIAKSGEEIANKQTVILLIGHGINLFMSTISSFVHPMRLTFVEFFKNAGFEMGTRAFEPLKNE